MQANKLDKTLSLKMSAIANQVQTLNEQLLTPFSTNNINMQVFFQDAAEKVKQREKELKEKIQREKEIEEKRRQRELEEKNKKIDIEQ